MKLKKFLIQYHIEHLYPQFKKLLDELIKDELVKRNRVNGAKSTTKFTSESASLAAKKRWNK